MRAHRPFFVGFFTVACGGALAHGARKERPITHEEAVAACVELRAHRFECREPFVDALIEREAAARDRPLSEGQRARMREAGLRKIVAEGDNLEASSRDKCRALADKMVAQRVEIALAKTRALKACYREGDCRKRVACMLPLVQDLLTFPAQR